MSGKHITYIIGLATMLLFSAACGSDDAEFTYDSGSYFPENYETQYQALGEFDCTKSPTHGGNYVKIYASDDAMAVYEGGSAPDGAVLVKPQYTDDTCSTLEGITVMRKDAEAESDWQWQRVSATGEIESEGQVAFCVNCHADLCGGGHCAEK